MAVDTVYSSAPLLRTPGRLIAAIRADMRIVPATAWRLFLRGFQARHRESALRYLWLVIPPLAGTATWLYLSHMRILPVGQTPVSYVIYVLSGILIWQLFADALNAPLEQLTAARSTLAKVRAPHESWVLSGVINALANFAVRGCLLAVALAWAGTSVGWALLLAPVGLLAVLALGLAIGLALAPIGLVYPDVGQTLRLVLGFWFFLTPVVYPTPDSAVVEFNPVTPVLVTARAWIVGGGGARPIGLAIVLGASLLVLAAGALVYRLAQPHIVARL
jgi:lipopolysaccharide transport system permease protein